MPTASLPHPEYIATLPVHADALPATPAHPQTPQHVVLYAVRVVLHEEAEEVDDEAQDGCRREARALGIDRAVEHDDLQQLVHVLIVEKLDKLVLFNRRLHRVRVEQRLEQLGDLLWQPSAVRPFCQLAYQQREEHMVALCGGATGRGWR
eukprot:25607-Chlamydomonas_euryale.AAC.2